MGVFDKGIFKNRRYKITQLYFYDVNAMYIMVIDRKYNTDEEILQEAYRQLEEELGKDTAEVLKCMYLDNLKCKMTFGVDDDLDRAVKYKDELIDYLLKTKERRYSILDLDEVNKRICKFFD